MSELISKQAAIDAVMDEFKRIPTNAIRAKIRIEALPPALPEQCDDAVSRAEVLRMIDCINDHHAITPYKSVGAVTEHLTRIASNLPPVTPKQRTGKWIKVANTLYKCDQCGTVQLKGNYCKDCGAKMEE